MKHMALALAACLLLSAQPGRAAELTPRDLTKEEQATIGEGVRFLTRTGNETRFKWLPLYVSGENPQATAYCGVVNEIYLFEADVVVQDGKVAKVSNIRLVVQNDDATRREVETLCSDAGYGAWLGQFFLPIGQ